MELRWRELVVCDYEIELGDVGALVEYDLYGRGLQAAPRMLLGEPAPLGITRRPGVIDIPAARYDDFCRRVRTRLLTLQGALQARDVFDAARARLSDAIHALEVALIAAVPPAGLDELAMALDEVMAFHTLNWMLPTREAAEHLSMLLGSAEAGRACLLAQMVPTVPAHLLDVHALLLETSQTGDLAAFADRAGYLQAQGMAKTAWENPAAVAASVAALRDRWAAEDHDDPSVQLTALHTAHQTADRRREALYAAALLASADDPAAYERTQAIAVACRLAADEEEYRKQAQQRVLRGLRMLGQAHGMDPTRLTLDQFIDLRCGPATDRPAAGADRGADAGRSPC
ncbi:hypothetical protein GCM10022214_47980 [Actinomadura miaoliensis]|uniref:XRE family transcriptional regulator n=2 Tax=Actinomadura miaoliensis TaxID=430685 RepID=A0ABP7W7E8_9ACTN